MIQMKHIGIYVYNLEKETSFYKNVFHMYAVCERVSQKDELIDDIFRNYNKGSGVVITKLITDRGKLTGTGDMLELIQSVKQTDADIMDLQLYHPGVKHICFNVDDIDEISKRIKDNGGRQEMDIHVMDNGNKCCFYQDPEGNWLEIIEQGNK